MICFPNAKINLGLIISSRIVEGLHNLNSFFLPIKLYDILEVIESPNQKKKIQINYSGIINNIDNDLCIKAYDLLDKDFDLPKVTVYLHKHIPLGSGLGGGSSNAVFMLKILNEMFELQLNEKGLLSYSRKIGSDCSFFIYNKPSFIMGVGDIIKPKRICLKPYKLLLITPRILISSSMIFGNYKKRKRKLNSNIDKVEEKIESKNFFDLVVKNDILNWKEILNNDLEEISFSMYPELKEIKDYLYEIGAIYASMSGSGSSVYGLFLEKDYFDFSSFFSKKDYFIWNEDLD